MAHSIKPGAFSTRVLSALGLAAALALVPSAASAAMRPVPHPANQPAQTRPAPAAHPEHQARPAQPAHRPGPLTQQHFPQHAQHAQHAQRPQAGGAGEGLAPHRMNALVVNVWATRVNVHAGPHVTDPVTEHAGTGPVFARCQAPGGSVSYGEHYNFWWTQLADGGWISDVFITGGGDDEPLPGVPNC
jgi:hypothetical protein